MSDSSIEQAKAFLESDTHKSGKVLIVGDLALDRYVFGEVNRISPEAPVAVLKSQREEHRLGCAANVFANASAFQEAWGLKLSIASVLGKDTTAVQLRAALSKASATAELLLLEDSERVTPLKTRFIAGSQHQLLRVDDETSGPMSEKVKSEFSEAALGALEGVSVLVLQDYAKGLLNHGLAQALIQESRKRGIFTVVDPNKNSSYETYMGAGIVTPNIEEAEILLGRQLDGGGDDSAIEDALRTLKSKLKLDSVMITRSRYGLSLVNANDEVTHLPALARDVFDVTGAGDTVVAVLAAALAAGASLEAAATLANVASSVVVAKVGTATLGIEELKTALAKTT